MIDEAYMLYFGSKRWDNDPYKTAVINAIVAEIQRLPGDDRCILLLGYEDKMKAMFQRVNPGLSRRFRLEDAFYFEDFATSQMGEIVQLQLKQQQLEASPEALSVAMDTLKVLRAKKTFSNAGEVLNLIENAKINYQARLTKSPTRTINPLITFEPIDFDTSFGRLENTVANCCMSLQGRVSQDIITELENMFGSLERAQESRFYASLLPTTFVFQGPPGQSSLGDLEWAYLKMLWLTDSRDRENYCSACHDKTLPRSWLLINR